MAGLPGPTGRGPTVPEHLLQLPLQSAFRVTGTVTVIELVPGEQQVWGEGVCMCAHVHDGDGRGG